MQNESFFEKYKKEHPQYLATFQSPFQKNDTFDMSQDTYETALNSHDHWGRPVSFDDPKRAIFASYDTIGSHQLSERNHHERIRKLKEQITTSQVSSQQTMKKKEA